MRDIERDLENLKRTEQINEWSVSLGYGNAEYTIEIRPTTLANIKALAKKLKEKYGAHSFAKYEERGQLAVKFVVNL